MRVILAGIIGRYPWGGVTWCSLMYLLGLRKLGHDVYYLEDTLECNYDPEINAIATDPRYALNHIHSSLKPFDFGDRWRYVDYSGKAHGIGDNQWQEICASAELMLVLSGGCWVWRDEYLKIPRKAFIDSDPAFTQMWLDKLQRDAGPDPKNAPLLEFFKAYDRHFSFGSNIGSPACTIPTAGFNWIPTWQPICTDLWKPDASALPSRSVWTTVMTWKIESFADIGGNKDQEFLKVLDLPERSAQTGGPDFELAINGPLELLRQHGWRCVEAFPISSDLWRYHSYLTSSRGEFSVAKHTYVSTNSGWFSDRTECYLAAGRPAVVQDSGFCAHLPTGKGLLSWTSSEEALEKMKTIETDYVTHARGAREIACEYFDSKVVLKRLLSRCV
jgi:hypothetical protein